MIRETCETLITLISIKHSTPVRPMYSGVAAKRSVAKKYGFLKTTIIQLSSISPEPRNAGIDFRIQRGKRDHLN
jgi:hypothetical protein